MIPSKKIYYLQSDSIYRENSSIHESDSSQWWCNSLIKTSQTFLTGNSRETMPSTTVINSTTLIKSIIYYSLQKIYFKNSVNREREVLSHTGMLIFLSTFQENKNLILLIPHVWKLLLNSKIIYFTWGRTLSKKLFYRNYFIRLTDQFQLENLWKS